MPERCSVCQQKFDIEPGFYWGAMYVAYMLSSGVLLATAGISILVFKMPVFYLWVVVFALYRTVGQVHLDSYFCIISRLV